MCIRDRYWRVLGKDASLQGPDAVKFRFLDERFQKRFADAAAPRRSSHVNGDLCDSSVNTATGDRAERGPAEDLLSFSRD